RVRLVAFTDPVLAPRTVDQSWALVKREAHATDNGPLTVEEYQVTALDSGEQHPVHLAGDVVLSAPGIELEDLESPPSVFPCPAGSSTPPTPPPLPRRRPAPPAPSAPPPSLLPPPRPPRPP